MEKQDSSNKSPSCVPITTTTILTTIPCNSTPQSERWCQQNRWTQATARTAARAALLSYLPYTVHRCNHHITVHGRFVRASSIDRSSMMLWHPSTWTPHNMTWMQFPLCLFLDPSERIETSPSSLQFSQIHHTQTFILARAVEQNQNECHQKRTPQTSHAAADGSKKTNTLR